ncbi:hypothetical protein HAALTHF_21560n [Vreelandella aquamarina]|nr:hypothetical protein HAALTHF_21560n [Halomonas axialensis]
MLEAAAADLAERLAEYGLTDIDSGLGDGKPQLEMRLSAEGRSLGLTGSDLAQSAARPAARSHGGGAVYRPPGGERGSAPAGAVAQQP